MKTEFPPHIIDNPHHTPSDGGRTIPCGRADRHM